MARDPSSDAREYHARPGLRVAAVVSDFHAELTDAMQRSARDELVQAGMDPTGYELARVPGALELPLVARSFARRDDIHAVLCFGLILKGETTHDHWVAHGATEGLVKVGLETDKPVLFGVLTCQTLEQARARALPEDSGGAEDKGREIARAALRTLAALEVARSSSPQVTAERSGD